MTANGDEYISKGRLLLSIPSGPLKRDISVGIEVLTKKSGETAKSKQAGSLPVDSEIRSLLRSTPK